MAWEGGGKLIKNHLRELAGAGKGTALYQSILADFIGTVPEEDKGKLQMLAKALHTAGRTPDGALVMAYLPSLRTVTVDMSQLGAPATARWYDPSRGTYTTIAGSPLQNAGKQKFTPPGNNGNGDGDWVLVLETKLPPTAK